MNNKKVLFVGGFFPDEEIDEILENSIGPVQNAANKLQWKFINGLETHAGDRLELMTTPFIGGFPKHYKKHSVQKQVYSTKCGTSISQLGYLNIMGLNSLSLSHVTLKFIKKWLEKNREFECNIIFYSLQIYYLKIVKKIKSSFPDVNLHIIVPDLPQYVGLDKKPCSIHGCIKKYHVNLCNTNIKWFDSYTVLTKYMIDALNLNESNCAVIEGICEDYDCDDIAESDNNLFVFAYTGTLTKKYGVLDLVKAFMLTSNHNYRLIICGAGETSNDILRLSEMDSRIIYLGQIDSREIPRIQHLSSVLVNPRQNNEEYTKYSFPSKIMEYLSSKRAVLCFRLDGFPEEYDDYLIYFDGNGLQEMANKMDEVYNEGIEALSIKGTKGAEFVYNKKNADVQVKKLLKVMKLL